MQESEQQLILAIQQGDTTLFTQLYDAYIEKIYQYLFYRTLHRQTAEDLTSQVFLKALDNIGSFKSGKGEFSAWIYRIARNALFDHLRAHHPAEDLSAADTIANSSDPARDTDASFEAERVREILSLLSEAERDLVTMRLWDELSYRQIAAITGKSEDSLKMQFSRTIAKLRYEHAHE